MKTRILFIISVVFILLLLLSQWIPTPKATATQIPIDETNIAETSTPKLTSEATPTVTIPVFLQITPSALSGIHISFWHPWTGSMGDTLNGLVDSFNKTNSWGITVEVRRFGGEQDLWDQVSQGILDGETPNLIAAPSEQLVEWQAPQQVFVDLNDYIFSSAYGLSPMEQSDYYSNIWNADVINGFRLGMPATRTGQVLYYNTSWAKELGFSEPPKTPADFKAQACAATQANANQHLVKSYGTGGWLIDSSWQTDLSWLFAFNFTEFPELKSKSFNFETTQAEAAQTFLRDLFDTNCAWYSGNQTPQDYLAGRYALFYAGDLRQIPQQLGAQVDTKSMDEWGIIPFPGEDGHPVFLIHGNSYAIFLSTPEQQLASWLFIRWMEQTQNQIQLVETEGSLPLTYSAVQALADYARGRSQWQSVIPLLENAVTPPQNSYWQEVRPILEDSYMILLSPQYLKANIPNMAKVLDTTIQEVLAQAP